MADRCNIVFEGHLRAGFDPQVARQNLARLFSTDAASVEHLFSGSPLALKSGLSFAEAQTYQDVLRQAGLETRLEGGSGLRLDKATEPQPASMVAPPATASTTPAAESPYAPPKTSVTEDLPEYGQLKVFTIQGRIGRLRYLAWSLVLTLALVVVASMCVGVLSQSLVGGGLLLAVVAFAFAVVSIMIGGQRLHDAGWSAWMLLLNLIPIVGNFFPLLMMAVPGTKGPNRFGPRPPPNTRAVKVLACLWLLFIVGVFVVAVTGGFSSVEQVIENTTGEYEQSLPYDDDSTQAPDADDAEDE